MKRAAIIALACALILLITVSGCAGGRDEAAQQTDSGTAGEAYTSATVSRKESTVKKIKLQIEGRAFTVTMQDNEAANALYEMLGEAPLVIQMSDYSGFEKVGSLPHALPASDRQTTAQSGDIVLYNSNQIVIFYGTNSWSYTRLGRVDDLAGWRQALEGNTVTVTLSLE